MVEPTKKYRVVKATILVVVEGAVAADPDVQGIPFIYIKDAIERQPYCIELALEDATEDNAPLLRRYIRTYHEFNQDAADHYKADLDAADPRLILWGDRS